MNLIESLNRGFEKMLKESIPLRDNTPYMMRHNGEVLEIHYVEPGPVDHPYVVDRVRRKESDFLKDSLYDRRKCWKWFYDNTESEKLRKDIQIFYQCLINSDFENLSKNNQLKELITAYFDLPFTLTAPTVTFTMKDALTRLAIIEESTNQEFLRFRIQKGFSGYDIFCRISSKDFNWYNNLCKFIFDHYSQLNTITVTNDMFTGVENETKTYKGQSIVCLPVREFVSFSGNPVLEDLNFVQNIFDPEFETRCKHYQLREGKLISDSLISMNPRLVVKNIQEMNMYLKERLEEKY